MTRRLALRRETLAELSVDDLRGVAGGATSPTCACTRYRCPSFDYCPTIPLRECPIYAE